MFNSGNSTPAVTRVSTLAGVQMAPLMRTVYMWMTVGLGLTGFIAFYLANAMMSNFALLETIAGSFLVIVIVQLVVVFGLSFAVNRVSPTVAIGLFLFYAATMGVTMSAIIFGTVATPAIDPRTGQIVMNGDWMVVAKAFFTTAGVFGAMTIIGYTTKTDLSSMGSFLMMALIGLIIASVVNIFLQSDGLTFILSVAGVLIFTGLTAWDTQKIKQMAESNMIQEGTPDFTRVAIMGALTLYLDFINIFLYLLRLFASSRD